MRHKRNGVFVKSIFFIIISLVYSHGMLTALPPLRFDLFESNFSNNYPLALYP